MQFAYIFMGHIRWYPPWGRYQHLGLLEETGALEVLTYPLTPCRVHLTDGKSTCPQTALGWLELLRNFCAAKFSVKKDDILYLYLGSVLSSGKIGANQPLP